MWLLLVTMDGMRVRPKHVQPIRITELRGERAPGMVRDVVKVAFCEDQVTAEGLMMVGWLARWMVRRVYQVQELVVVFETRHLGLGL